MKAAPSAPSVTVAIPVLDEARHIDDCLAAVAAQTYPAILEVLVIDGGSRDDTVARARRFPGVRVLHNPRRRQAAALNLALEEARGEILVRVDGHCLIAPDYVARCVAALSDTGAAMVGGAQVPVPAPGFSGGVGLAMGSRLGAGPARFHHPGGRAGWVDTVYLGAYRVADARQVGGYQADQTTNEDAELAWRLGQHGGVWFDPTIRSVYLPRGSLRALARQFFAYGQGRARTVWRHPRSLSPRQLAAPALVVGLVGPWRNGVAAAYALMLTAVLVSTAARTRAKSLVAALAAPLAVATMHLAWGVGFLTGGPAAVRERRRAGPRA